MNVIVNGVGKVSNDNLCGCTRRVNARELATENATAVEVLGVRGITSQHGEPLSYLSKGTVPRSIGKKNGIEIPPLFSVVLRLTVICDLCRHNHLPKVERCARGYGEVIVIGHRERLVIAVEYRRRWPDIAVHLQRRDRQEHRGVSRDWH